MSEFHGVSFLAMKIEWEKEVTILALLSNSSWQLDLESLNGNNLHRAVLYISKDLICVNSVMLQYASCTITKHGQKCLEVRFVFGFDTSQQCS